MPDRLLPRLVLTAAAAAVVLAAPARAQGVDETCLLPLTKVDPATVNIAFPDDSALYYGAAFALSPGTRVRITGRFPHARYMSFNAYDAALRPVDAITDVDIRPDAGSANPFLTGAERRGDDGRAYTVFLADGAKPATPAVNTIYPNGGQPPNPVGLLLYRVYVPDRDTGETGGVGLPTVTLESTASNATPSPSACTNFTKPSVTGINELLVQTATPAGISLPNGTNPPRWRRFVNLASSIALNVTGTPNPGGIDLDTLGGEGGFLSNKDNQYVSAPINRTFGDVVVTRMRVGTFPDTRPGAATMPSAQLRYWSLCQNDPITQRYIACANDDRTVTDGGWATFVVTPPGSRPRHATRACGVNWLPWGPNPRGLLLYRNMLPDPGFRQAVQFARADHEQETMGDFLPVSRYYRDAVTFDAQVGCHPPSAGGGAAPAARAACTSRRVVTLRLPARARKARAVRVRIGRAHSHVVPVRAGRVRVDLRGVVKGTYVLRVTRGGRVLVHRAVRTCRGRA